MLPVFGVGVSVTFGLKYVYIIILCLWEGILFSRCPSESVSETFCFLNILKSH